MKKTILALLLATTTLSFADIYKDACDDFDKEHAKNKSLSILQYVEELSTRTNKARNANNQDEADRLLKLFTVTVSTGLGFGIDNNPAPALVNRLITAMDNVYNPLSKMGVSPQDLAESFNDMDEVFEISRTRGTLDQYAAVVEHSYHAVGLHKIKPWDQISKITDLKTTPPSQIFKSILEDTKDKDKPKPITVTLSPNKKEDLTVIKSFTAFNYSQLDYSLQSEIKEEYEILTDLNKFLSSPGGSQSVQTFLDRYKATYLGDSSKAPLKLFLMKIIAFKLTQKGVLTIVKYNKQPNGFNLENNLFFNLTKKHTLANHQTKDCYLDAFSTILRINDQTKDDQITSFLEGDIPNRSLKKHFISTIREKIADLDNIGVVKNGTVVKLWD